MEAEKIISQFVEFLNKQSEEDIVSEEDKKRAAYALNMCTVSVSQIVDYNDLNVLEQEYEAILNNLNLEQMPKDDALLHILKQLLDTITFFRIQDGDKKIIEKEYQQKMKNAIWSAVPNFGLLIAGGNPVTMAISLASQVGIGYMNYRRNKNEYLMDKEKQEWQLKRTAIEQFNGLRRELFDTAWRLADKYNFPDTYRLTERQIKQYNEILMDTDEIRKYERLESIKDNFRAYPAFWYFFGNAANYIAGNAGFSQEVRDEYRQRALEHFEEYEKLSEYSILREDPLAASCALEHADLLIEQANYDEQKVLKLIDKAVQMSGNAKDVLEICALTYLKVGQQEKAETLLKILVNEDYNRVINAQMLSGIYVRKLDRKNYELLSSRVDSSYLYPMPKKDEDLQQLEEEFGGRQRSVLQQKFRISLDNLVVKYSIQWNKLTSIFDAEYDYQEKFFLDTRKAKEERKAAALRVLQSDGNKKEYYEERIKNASYELSILDILNNMFGAVLEIDVFSDEEIKYEVVEAVKTNLRKYQEEINKLQQAMNKGEFTYKAYLVSQEISLSRIVKDAIELLIKVVDRKIQESNINEITYIEASLSDFCHTENIKDPEIAINDGSNFDDVYIEETEMFGPELFGQQAVVAKKNAKFIADMTAFIKEKMGSIHVDESLKVYYKDDSEFNGYFYNMAFEGHSDIKSHAMMIIKETAPAGKFFDFNRKPDLIFTTDGIVTVKKDTIKYLTPYKEVKMKSDAIVLYNTYAFSESYDYKSSTIDIPAFFDLIKELGKRFVKSIDEKIEYIEGTITVTKLNEWFKSNPEAMREGVVRIYASPTYDLLSHLGFNIEENLDPDSHLLQYYYDEKTNDLLGFRVVEFEAMESNFQAKMIEYKGYMRVGK